jgi:hypothetical protein
LTHRFNSDTVIIRDKGRRKADNDRVAALKQNSCLFGTVYYLFGILRAHNKATSAQNTLITDDMGLISRKAYGFNGTIANTFIAILAIGFF